VPGGSGFGSLTAVLLPTAARFCRSASSRATSLPITHVRGSRLRPSGRISNRRSAATLSSRGFSLPPYREIEGLR
jgi:hypothetical protein